MANRGLADLMIVRIPGLSPRDRVKLAREFGGEKNLLLSKKELEALLDRNLPRKPGRDWTMEDVKLHAEKDAALARYWGIGYVSIAEEEYPSRLQELEDPPAVLFYRGRLPDPESSLTAIVGTRRPTPAAGQEAYTLARDLGRGGMAVVSGLALGIDAIAHRGNIEGGAPTLAVLGSGLDQVYPASNRVLAGRVIEAGGALLSEYPPGTGPRKWNFPARNRIISALARGTVIIEAPASSGALITACFTRELGRNLWVSPAGLSSPLGEGVRKLAGEGAVTLCSALDIFKAWGIEPGEENTAFFSPEVRETGAGGETARFLAEDLARSLQIEL